MKILQITADYKWTGPAEPMLNVLMGLRDRGHQVELACPAPPEDSDRQLLDIAHARGVEPVHLLERARGFRPLGDRREIRELRRLVSSRGYEIVHAHHTRDHLLSLRALRGGNAKLVVSWHHGDPIPMRSWDRLLLGPRGAEGLVVLSERLAEHAREVLGWPAERVAAISGSVDTRRFRPRPPDTVRRASLGLRPESRVICVVARLQPHRRFDLLLAAFARALARAPDLRLLVLGRGTRARQVLHEPVAELGLEKAVIHAGHRSGDYVDVLALADALVFLVPGSDGSCRALLEAMSLGVPGIVGPRGMLPETVRDGETGRVVAEEIDSLAAAFEDVSLSPSSWKAFGKAARERALTLHSIPDVTSHLERFYARLLADGLPKEPR